MQIKLSIDKGLNADALSSELADGYVSDCDNVRFPGVGAQRIGGGSVTTAYTGVPGWLGLLTTPTASHVVGIGSSTSAGSRVAYVHTIGGATSNITRYTEGVAITNMTASGTTVTVTAPSHGLSTGNTVSVWGSVPTTYNVESASITVTGANAFTYTAASAPSTSPATTFGLYSAGTSRQTHTSYGDDATGGDYGGVMIVNLPDDGIYYWAGDTSIPMRKMPAGRSEKADVARPFGRFIVRLAVTTSGTKYPFRVSWSNPAEPGSLPDTFTSASDNQAGNIDKPEIGRLVDCLPMGDDLILYGSRGRMVMRYLENNNSVFAFTKLPGEEGVYSRNCIVDTPVGHVFLSSNKHVLLHSGGATKDISDDRVQSIISGAEGINFRLAVHPTRPEVWVMYAPSEVLGASDIPPNSSLVWNWETNTWGRSSAWGGWSALGVESSFYCIQGNNFTKIDDNKAAHSFTAYIEREGITAGDPHVVKNLQRSRPYVKTNGAWTPLSDLILVEHGSSMHANTDATYASQVVYNVGTNSEAVSRATGGKYLAWKLSIGQTSANANAGYHNITVRTADLEFTLGGRR